MTRHFQQPCGHCMVWCQAPCKVLKVCVQNGGYREAAGGFELVFSG